MRLLAPVLISSLFSLSAAQLSTPEPETPYSWITVTSESPTGPVTYSSYLTTHSTPTPQATPLPAIVQARDKPKPKGFLPRAASNPLVERHEQARDKTSAQKDGSKKEKKANCHSGSKPGAKPNTPKTPATGDPAAVNPKTPKTPATGDPAAVNPKTPKTPATGDPAAVNPKTPKEVPATGDPAAVNPKTPKTPATGDPAAVNPKTPKEVPATGDPAVTPKTPKEVPATGESAVKPNTQKGAPSSGKPTEETGSDPSTGSGAAIANPKSPKPKTDKGDGSKGSTRSKESDKTLDNLAARDSPRIHSPKFAREAVNNLVESSEDNGAAIATSESSTEEGNGSKGTPTSTESSKTVKSLAARETERWKGVLARFFNFFPITEGSSVDKDSEPVRDAKVARVLHSGPWIPLLGVKGESKDEDLKTVARASKDPRPIVHPGPDLGNRAARLARFFNFFPITEGSSGAKDSEPVRDARLARYIHNGPPGNLLGLKGHTVDTESEPVREPRLARLFNFFPITEGSSANKDSEPVRDAKLARQFTPESPDPIRIPRPDYDDPDWKPRPRPGKQARSFKSDDLLPIVKPGSKDDKPKKHSRFFNFFPITEGSSVDKNSEPVRDTKLARFFNFFPITEGSSVDKDSEPVRDTRLARGFPTTNISPGQKGSKPAPPANDVPPRNMLGSLTSFRSQKAVPSKKTLNHRFFNFFPITEGSSVKEDSESVRAARLARDSPEDASPIAERHDYIGKDGNWHTGGKEKRHDYLGDDLKWHRGGKERREAARDPVPGGPPVYQGKEKRHGRIEPDRSSKPLPLPPGVGPDKREAKFLPPKNGDRPGFGKEKRHDRLDQDGNWVPSRGGKEKREPVFLPPKNGDRPGFGKREAKLPAKGSRRPQLGTIHVKKAGYPKGFPKLPSKREPSPGRLDNLKKPEAIQLPKGFRKGPRNAEAMPTGTVPGLDAAAVPPPEGAPTIPIPTDPLAMPLIPTPIPTPTGTSSSSSSPTPTPPSTLRKMVRNVEERAGVHIGPGGRPWWAKEGQ
ncbi:hypothetical protein VTL71DRAFT_4746 [Oculimacula yallundae]|uniref:Uncharacterized protein n=1 Tax=Oculimacula yallundae TaxID=86028 RepID=A0ABR4C2W3_9HELO